MDIEKCDIYWFGGIEKLMHKLYFKAENKEMSGRNLELSSIYGIPTKLCWLRQDKVRASIGMWIGVLTP